ncbi:MAG: S41 family peptidase [Candidatus Cloacimonetes bacterium]|nr:S41 family peptidase [Candidatus Cloacimonadota bacterium]
MMPKQRTALITIASLWILTATLLMIATTAFSQTNAVQGNDFSQIRLFSEVLFKLKQNYVTELSDSRLIEAAINGMRREATGDSTFVPLEELGNAYEPLDLFAREYRRLLNDPQTKSSEKLIEAALKGMLRSTDPHSVYMNAEEFKEFTTSTKGSFGGLGIQIDKIGDYITVVSPIEGTPAYRMGITAGDRIIKVDGESIIGVTTDESIKKMRGDPGTTVLITISRPGIDAPIEFTIVREIIKVKSVPYSFQLDNGVGYIRISQFNENTTSELRSALDELETEGIKGLIIDLRFNPGGLLDQAVNTVNEFIGPNKLVVETRGRTRSDALHTRYRTKERTYPIVVLVNQASASASEIFAGSLQDWDKGIVVGKTTFGKGSVQQLIPFGDIRGGIRRDGPGMKITTSYYYIKSGRCIHKMSNDKLLSGQQVSESDLKKEDEENHNTVYYTEKGREVFGGGGIAPDIEVENDLLTRFGVDLRSKNIFFNFAVDYLVDHNHQVSKNPSITPAIMDEFLGYAEDHGISYTPADLDSARTFIENSLKSELVRKVHGDLESYKITLSQDKQLQKAISLFDRYRTLDEMIAYVENQKKLR